MAVVSGAYLKAKGRSTLHLFISHRAFPSHAHALWQHCLIFFRWQEAVRMRAVRRKCAKLLHCSRPLKVWTHLPLACCLLLLSKKLNFGCVLTMHTEGLFYKTRIGKQSLTVVRRVD